jgi:hypothetical protein
VHGGRHRDPPELSRRQINVLAAAPGPGVLAASLTGLAPVIAWCLAQVRIRERFAGPVDRQPALASG